MLNHAYIEDIISLALFYNYEATEEKEIPWHQLEKYINIVNSNLQKENKNYFCMHYPNNIDRIYLLSNDNMGLPCLTFKLNINILKERKKLMLLSPLELIVASQTSEALESIGLQLSNGKITKLDYKTYKKTL